MLLSDFGADVIIVDRLTKGAPEIPYIMKKIPFDRGKRSMRVNLKSDDGIKIIKRMMGKADVLVEPYRPGVMEALGLGPDDALKLNPKLVFARLTGWGQTGDFASMAGHDINYIALSGALSLFRRKGERRIRTVKKRAVIIQSPPFCSNLKQLYLCNILKFRVNHIIILTAWRIAWPFLGTAAPAATTGFLLRLALIHIGRHFLGSLV